MYIAEPGDILLYRKIDSGFMTELAIDLGERLEDGPETREYYHVVIALNANTKIECNGSRVQILPIDYGKFDAFRPPIPPQRINDALRELRGLVGQRYDWWLILDDTLRFLTGSFLHLPESLILSEERQAKICSTLAAFYFGKVGWGHLRTWPRPTPEDVWLEVMGYEVGGDET